MSKKISDLLNSLFTAIKISTEEFVLPTGKHLMPATIISFVILAVVTLFRLLNVYTIIDIPGAALGCLILCTICFIERRERSEISKIYSTVKASIGHLKGGKAGIAPNQSARVNSGDTQDSVGGRGNTENGPVHSTVQGRSEGFRTSDRDTEIDDEEEDD